MLIEPSDRRKKCIRLRQGMSCNFCVSRGLHCTPPEEVKSASSEELYAPLGLIKADEKCPPISSALNADSVFVEEIVDLYFRYYHVSFPSLFHPPSFKLAARDRSIPKILFFGIASLAARYSSHPSIVHLPPWDRGKPYAEEAERLLNLHETSLISIQACVLLGVAAITQGEPDTESNFYCLAYRMALILDLPNAVASSALEKEIHVRGKSNGGPRWQCVNHDNELLTVFVYQFGGLCLLWIHGTPQCSASLALSSGEMM